MSTLEVNTITSQSGTTLTLGGSGDTVSVASVVTNNLGITEADQWRLTTSASGNNEPLTSNLSRVDKFGTGMTESSGVFTFPSTGYWWIRFTARFIGDGESRYLEGKIQKTTDNSTYTNGAISSCATSDFGTGNIELSSSSDFLFDVTNTSTHKVRFSIGMQNTSFSAHGTASTNLTSMTFLRLGDT
jgi:hypothetical protein